MGSPWLEVLTILALASLTLLAGITIEVTWPGAMARGLQTIAVAVLEGILKQAKGTTMSKVAELYEAVLAGNDDVVLKTGDAKPSRGVGNSITVNMLDGGIVSVSEI